MNVRSKHWIPMSGLELAPRVAQSRIEIVDIPCWPGKSHRIHRRDSRNHEHRRMIDGRNLIEKRCVVRDHGWSHVRDDTFLNAHVVRPYHEKNAIGVLHVRAVHAVNFNGELFNRETWMPVVYRCRPRTGTRGSYERDGTAPASNPLVERKTITGDRISFRSRA